MTRKSFPRCRCSLQLHEPPAPLLLQWRLSGLRKLREMQPRSGLRKLPTLLVALDLVSQAHRGRPAPRQLRIPALPLQTKLALLRLRWQIQLPLQRLDGAHERTRWLCSRRRQLLELVRVEV